MGVYQFDPEPDPHFRFVCEHGAWTQMYKCFDWLVRWFSHCDISLLILCPILRSYCIFELHEQKTHRSHINDKLNIVLKHASCK